MRKVIVALILIGLLVGSASAWNIVDKENRVFGTVDFYGNGSGILNVTSGPIIDFKWYQSGDVIRAVYLFYGIDIQYNSTSDELYSVDIENVTLRR